MADLCEGGNEPSGSLKAICVAKTEQLSDFLPPSLRLAIMSCTRVSVCVSVVSGMSDDDEDEEGKRGNPMLAHSLLLLNSTKRAARLNVPIQWTNHYQQ
ncbi:hypothetical protein ANN_01586 [Periplaneta americana]|uniref:Uncharacterized protein n=1 Tax=Periplaneta americana TaxID=6978 RepID=A0ABQ8TU14_PERAM|nr:hypothetical protein ANN_01586 [Periplaneta americana]